MAFATRADLLARSNARRVAQLAVPADMEMPPFDALRVAIVGGDLTVYTPSDRDTLSAALAVIDEALGDADELILSYGIPSTVGNKLLARIASTIALYYLHGAGEASKEVNEAYTDAVAKLKAHTRGEINLLPVSPSTATEPCEDAAIIASAPGRYGKRLDPDDEVGL